MEKESEYQESPYTPFILANKIISDKRKYLQRLGYFLSYLDINDGNIEKRYNVPGQMNISLIQRIIHIHISTHEI
jgi:hypothetical protein